jgi:hypothetical protein
LFGRPFVWSAFCLGAWLPVWIRRLRVAKIISTGAELVTNFGYCVFCRLVRRIMNMRLFASVLILSAAALPCAAQTILKSEPLVLAPYEIAFVQDAACSAGKVLKVTGAIRGLHRRKVCVLMSSTQASLATATP